ncbi:hypothetical protein PROFUN_00590 [Planoprotostelium fungivorum]|uniref:Obg-like ATPase 1 n=1 Tax=Planoprotostelium fungivorum TaxID=1890364 RepID=A0A2P6N1A8_9EUKA|nr:hypothetical protein PROFUN_00590 [Planoprotostelium fungivorum]
MHSLPSQWQEDSTPPRCRNSNDVLPPNHFLKILVMHSQWRLSPFRVILTCVLRRFLRDPSRRGDCRRNLAAFLIDATKDLNDINTPDGLYDFFLDLDDMFTKREDDAPPLHLEWRSLFGIYLRKVRMAFKKLMFEELARLFNGIKRYIGGEAHIESPPAIDLARNTREYEAGVSGVDSSIPTNKNMKSVLPYSVLNLAVFHYHFGNIKQAITAIDESVRAAQDRNDTECLLYCMSWLRTICMEMDHSLSHNINPLVTSYSDRLFHSLSEVSTKYQHINRKNSLMGDIYWTTDRLRVPKAEHVAGAPAVLSYANYTPSLQEGQEWGEMHQDEDVLKTMSWEIAGCTPMQMLHKYIHSMDNHPAQSVSTVIALAFRALEEGDSTASLRWLSRYPTKDMHSSISRDQYIQGASAVLFLKAIREGYTLAADKISQQWLGMTSPPNLPTSGFQDRYHALHSRAVYLSSIHRYPQARHVINQILEQCKEGQSVIQLSAMTSLAEVLIQSGDFIGATRTLLDLLHTSSYNRTRHQVSLSSNHDSSPVDLSEKILFDDHFRASVHQSPLSLHAKFHHILAKHILSVDGPSDSVVHHLKEAASLYRRLNMISSFIEVGCNSLALSDTIQAFDQDRQPEMPPKKQEEEVKRVILGRPSNNLAMGIVGLPNVGKSTLFNVLTKLTVLAENYPFCTIDPNEARVNVPDERFEWLVNHFKPSSAVPAALTITDIAGLIKGASTGEGLGNAFLSHIRAVDGIYHVCRVFDDADVTHVEGEIDPVRDLNIIIEELILKDIETVAKIKDKTERELKSKKDKQKQMELDVYTKLATILDARKQVRLVTDWKAVEIEVINTLQLLTAKPVVYLVNMSVKDYIRKGNKWIPKLKAWVDANGGEPMVPVCGAVEANYLNMSADEVKAYNESNKVQSSIPKIISTGYHALQLIHFFTSGTDEVKCWTIRTGVKAPQAAGVIHTDFERGFVCAEVMKYEDYKELGSESAVKAAGKYKQEGRNYEVKDGDILFFKVKDLDHIKPDPSQANTLRTCTCSCRSSSPCSPPNHFSCSAAEPESCGTVRVIVATLWLDINKVHPTLSVNRNVVHAKRCTSNKHLDLDYRYTATDRV